MLSGKYNGGKLPAGARFSEYLKPNMPARQRNMGERFVNAKSLAATAELMELAQQLEMDPVTLAVAWSKQHSFVASTIVGANSIDQLKPSLAAAGVRLSDTTLAAIDRICARHPYPMG